MKFKSNILASRATALLSGAMLLAMLPAGAAMAADKMPVKGVPAAETGWYYYGELDAGTNIWIKKPGDGYGRTNADPFWLTPTTSDSRAKMDEYGKVPRSVFLDTFEVHAGKKDGSLAIDFWADNVGYDNQRYYLQVYEPGRQYFNVGWDSTPHLLGTSAKSIFGGVGSTNLTVDAASRTFLQSQLGIGAAGQTQTNRNNIDDFVNGRNALGGAGFAAPMNQLELKTLREKLSLGYRNTMLDSWDFNVDYSTEHRTGTRPLGIGWAYSAPTTTGTLAAPRPSAGAIEVPQPLDDRTQIANAAGEYVGTTPWGTRWNTSVKYSGSFRAGPGNLHRTISGVSA